MKRFKWIFLLIFISGHLVSCKNENEFGGTVAASESVSIESIAKSVLDSKSVIIRIRKSSAHVDSLGISLLRNVAGPMGFTAPLNLSPDVSSMGQISGDWLSLIPAQNGQAFWSPFSQDLGWTKLTMIAVVRGDSRGEIFSLNPSDRLNQAFRGLITSSSVESQFLSSPSDFESSAVAIVNQSSDQRILVSTFGDDLGLITSVVNGRLVEIPKSSGSPVAPMVIPRYLSLGPQFQSEAIWLKDFVLIDRRLTYTEMGALTLYLGSLYGVQDLVLDTKLQVSTGSGGTNTDPRFGPAQAVVSANCVNCHSSWASAKASYYVSSGLVIKGSPENSKLYYRLSGSSGSNGPKTMPQSAGALSAADLEAIRTWIQNMN